jgi:hypothetical protein
MDPRHSFLPEIIQGGFGVCVLLLYLSNVVRSLVLVENYRFFRQGAFAYWEKAEAL